MGCRQVLTSEKGSVTVEFFLAIPIIVVVMVAAIQVVGVARARVELQGAVREGVRVAATTPNPARAVEAVLDALPPAVRGATRVSVQRPARAGAQASVSATSRHLLGPPFPSGLGVDLSATATMMTER